jgi:hypothetical protein
MLSLMLAAAAFGTDPSPEGVKTVHDLMDVSAKFCAPIFRDAKAFDFEKTLLALGFIEKGEREDSQPGPYKVSYISWQRADALHLSVRLLDGAMSECTVYSPRSVWNQVEPQLPAYIKATGLPLVVNKTDNYLYYGGGFKASLIGGGTAGGTVLKLERYRD